MREQVKLIGRPRFVVRYYQQQRGLGRLTRVETLAGQPPRVREMKKLGCTVVIFSSQEDGTIHMVQRELVKDVVIEQADVYAQYHPIGLYPLTVSEQ